MTTAARPTFEPARGGRGKGEGDLSQLSKQYSSRDLPSHTKIKYRLVSFSECQAKQAGNDCFVMSGTLKFPQYMLMCLALSKVLRLCRSAEQVGWKWRSQKQSYKLKCIVGDLGRFNFSDNLLLFMFTHYQKMNFLGSELESELALWLSHREYCHLQSTLGWERWSWAHLKSRKTTLCIWQRTTV